MESLDRPAVRIDGFSLLVLANDASVVDATASHRHRSDPGHDGSRGHVSVADHEPVVVLVHKVAVIVDPRSHLGLDSLGEKLLGSVSQNFGQNIIRACSWHRQRFRVTLHQAYSLLPAWAVRYCFHNTKGTPLF